jgi:hypothetical protein
MYTEQLRRIRNHPQMAPDLDAERECIEKGCGATGGIGAQDSASSSGTGLR